MNSIYFTEEEKKKGEVFRFGIRAVLRHTKPFQKEITLLIILGLVSAATNGFVPYVTGRFFDALILLSKGEGALVSGVPVWVALLLFWAITQFIASNVDWVMDRTRRNVSTKMHFNVQIDGFTHLFRLPISFHRNEKINGVLERISNASWRMSAILRTVIDIAPQFLSIFIGITLAASINAMLAGVLLLGVLLYSLLLLRILSPMAAIDRAAHETWNNGWNDAASAVQQIDTVKQAATEEYETKKVSNDLLGKSYALWYRLERNWSNVGFFQRIIVFATQLVIFILSVGFVSHGEISVGELIALNGYALMFFGPFVSLGGSWQTIQNGLTSAAYLEKMLLQKEEVYVPENAQMVGEHIGEVEFDNVSFRYAPGQAEILSDISFRVRPGEVAAFVGASGVGKSTCMSLLSGYYFPEEGSVRVGGVDTRNLNLESLRKQIAVVPQEVALFNATLRENIRYGSFHATDEDIIGAAKQAHIHDFIQKLPKEYDTVVGERGVKLSVGQKQRLAIARAILRDPKILVLDEPTSALDSKTEQLIADSLEKLMRGRTTFTIAHRLSTVRKADKIFFIENGRIVESGSHQALMAKPDGKYRKIYELHIGLHG